MRPIGLALIPLTTLVLASALARPSLGASLSVLERDSPSAKEAVAEIERGNAARLAGASAINIYSPVFSIAGTDDTTLFLLNTFGKPMEAEVFAISDTGRQVSLGRFTVETTRHLELSLRDQLAAAHVPFTRGSLRVAFNGDSGMLQSWAIRKRGAQVVEVRLAEPEAGGKTPWSSAWDCRPLRSSHCGPRIHLLNPSARTATVILDVRPGGAPDEGRTTRVRVRPGSTVELRPAEATYGSLRLTADTPFVATAALEGAGVLAALPLAQPPTAPQGALLSMPFPLPGQSDVEMSIVTLYNPDRKRSSVTLQILDTESGRPLASFTRALAPEAVASIDLGPELSEATAEGRLVIDSAPGVLVYGYSTLRSGEMVDFAFFPSVKAHKSGSYPLPDPDRYDVTTTFVNLGDSPARVAGQVSWDGGTYTLGPYRVPSHSSYRVDFAQVADKKVPDMLGRTLDPAMPHGFFQWSAHSTEPLLIARTEARIKGGGDRFGFNCFGCCSEIPSGLVLPASIAFNVGQVPPFEAAEIDHTCQGDIGPMPVDYPTLSYTSPLAWDGEHVSTSGLTYQTLSFTAPETKLTVTCHSAQITIRGSGPGTVDKCLADNDPGHDPTRGCNQAPNSTSCASCYTCCDNEKKVAYCRCDQTGGGQPCENLAVASCGTCKQACFGTYAESCSTQVTSCSP
jgi:hypothetical protein